MATTPPTLDRLNDDVCQLKNDVSEIKSKVETVASDMDGIKQTLSRILQHLGVKDEYTQANLPASASVFLLPY